MQTSIAIPRRSTFERCYVYGGLFAAVALFMPLFIRVWLKMDLASRNWDSFRSAGATAGTDALVDPARHFAWQTAHHHIMQIFPYPPAAAWLYAPLAPLPANAGIIVNAGFVLAACFGSALLASRIYMAPFALAIVAVFAWQPALDSIQSAENGAAIMLAAFAAIFGFVRKRPIALGVAVGVLLLKPTFAIAFILLLTARRQWAALGVASACGIIIYGASAAAAGWNWAWTSTYAQAIHTYYAADFSSNQTAAVTIPSLLMRANVPAAFAIACGAALVLFAIPVLARRSPLEAASVTPLIALAASPHAWGYDGALIVPALFFGVTALKEQWRWPLLGVIYCLGLMQSASTIVIGFNTLSIVVVFLPFVFLARLKRSRLVTS